MSTKIRRDSRAAWRSFAFTVLLIAPAAAWPALDLIAFDDDVMRSMDDAYKDLEPVLGASNAVIAKENLAILRDGYQWTREYFSEQEKEGKDGLEVLKAGGKLLDEIEGALNKRDFTGAAAKARDLNANCKSCHEKYKPKKQ